MVRFRFERAGAGSDEQWEQSAMTATGNTSPSEGPPKPENKVFVLAGPYSVVPVLENTANPCVALGFPWTSPSATY